MAFQPITLTCPRCGREFVGAPHRKFCTKSCANFARAAARPPTSIAVRVARFWAKVDTSGACWVWTGCRLASGYGIYKVGVKTFTAHRWLYEHIHGPCAEGVFVLHKCDNPPCVRPSHLFSGDHQANMDDKAAKGRVARGVRCATARLTDDLVRAMRADLAAGMGHREAAERYGVSRRMVRNINARRAWKHVS